MFLILAYYRGCFWKICSPPLRKHYEVKPKMTVQTGIEKKPLNYYFGDNEAIDFYNFFAYLSKSSKNN